MSHIFHLWQGPAPRDISEAEAILRNLSLDSGGQNPKFIEFARQITAIYPDFNDCDEPEECVWSDSPIDGKTHSPVYAIGVLSQHLSEHLVISIVRAAAANGLHAFDMQAGRLYRPDLSYVSADNPAPTAVPPLPARPDAAAKPSLPAADDIRKFLLRQFIAAHPEEGWTLHVANRFPGFWHVSRQLGAVTQKLKFDISVFDSAATVSVGLGFVLPEVHAVIEKIAPRHHAWMSRIREQEDKTGRTGNDYRDISPSLDALLAPEELAAISGSFRSIQEMRAWGERFIAWYRSVLQARLSASDHAASLSRLFDSAHFRDTTLRQGCAPESWLTYLLIEQTASSPHLPEWAANLQRRTAMALRERMHAVVRELHAELAEVASAICPTGSD